MTPTAIVLLVAMAGYAIYRQTQEHEVVGSGRFTLALIYGGVGLVVGGFARPDGWAEWLLLAASLALSIVVGLARGRLTSVWRGEDGRVRSRGTPVTISLFVALVAVKFGMGTVAYFAGISDDGGFGEILLMIAVMVAFQAELVWRRGRALGARSRASEPAVQA